MTFRLFTAALLSPLAMAGAAGIAGAATAAPAPPPRPIVVQQSQDGRVVQLQRSQRLVIRLPSNPSTGYGWQVVTVNRTVLQQEGAATYVPNPNPRKWVGVGGVEVFRFRVIGAGNTQLRLAYRRWWERSQRPAQTFGLRVIVHR